MRRVGAGFILLVATLIVGCTPAANISQGPSSPVASVETSPGETPASDDPSLSHLDSEGQQPEDVVLELIDAINSSGWETAYSLYASPEVDFAVARREWTESSESYRDFVVHETRVVAERTACVRVTYSAETTSAEGGRYSAVVNEPGEWWGLSLVDGRWRVNWFRRQ